MLRSFSLLFVLSILLVLVGLPVFAQTDAPLEVLIRIYKVAPGKHVDFLKWQAQQETVAKEAGVAPTQWYVHQDGADWDYVSIGPVLTSDQEKKTEEIAKKKGLPTGFKTGLEFRKYIATHTDTFARGPVSVSDLITEAQ